MGSPAGTVNVRARRLRLVRRRPLSIVTIALLGAVVVLLILVWFAVYRPAAIAAGLATFVVLLVWLSDRRDRARRARLRAAASGPAASAEAPPS